MSGFTSRNMYDNCHETKYCQTFYRSVFTIFITPSYLFKFFRRYKHTYLKSILSVTYIWRKMVLAI